MAENKESALCKLCKVALLNEQTRQAHLMGKKHQLALHRERMNEQRAKCGIFVSGLPNLISHEEILELFAVYGKIIEHRFGDGNRFAIIQFSSPEPVDELLKAGPVYKGKRMYIKRRVLRGRDTGQHDRAAQPVENFDKINESLKDLPDFPTQVVMLVQQVQPNWLEMVAKYQALCADLQNVLREVFPGCTVHPFGSTVTGLSFTSSDVDIYVEVSRVIDTESPSTNEHSRAAIFVNKSKKLLQRYGAIFSQVFAIPRAKTPIIKCVHIPTKISCDFNFKNMLGVCNSSLTQYYLSLDNKLKSVVIILKYWAKVHELSGSSGKFSNYSLIMLVIFYLQQSPYFLPPIIVLQESPNCINLQDGWNGGFRPVANFVTTFLADQNIPKILLGFFEYYSNFDYSLNIICPYLGFTVPKTDFLRTELLPAAFERYKMNMTVQPPLKVECPICVQDPFEQNHNITSSIPAKLLEDFVTLCKFGADLFKEHPVNSLALYKLLTEEIESIDNGRYIGSDNDCRFKIAMGSFLLHLNQVTTSSGEIPSSSDDTVVRLRAAWYKEVNSFILTVLTKVLKFTVSVEACDIHSKAQRVNGQADVHDTNVVDSVCFFCFGKYNLWETRRSISKDISDLLEPLRLLDKQIYLTNYMCDLFKGLTLNDIIIEFNIKMHARMNPTEMVFHLTKIDSRKGCFKSFAVFFAKNMPVWFEKHLAELDRCLQSELDKQHEVHLKTE